VDPLRAKIVGHWRVDRQSTCISPDVASDELVFLKDGKFEQHTLLNDGRSLDSNGSWQYSAGSLQVTGWFDVFHQSAPSAAKRKAALEFSIDPAKTSVIFVRHEPMCYYHYGRRR
jgi:hypothetical protein